MLPINDSYDHNESSNMNNNLNNNNKDDNSRIISELAILRPCDTSISLNKIFKMVQDMS